MNLRTALEVYQREGPQHGEGASGDARIVATRVVHLYATPAEQAALVQAWAAHPVGRAPFLQVLTLLQQRLAAEGHL
jgi:hypothetical protein